jgi:hypothetical protein
LEETSALSSAFPQRFSSFSILKFDPVSIRKIWGRKEREREVVNDGVSEVVSCEEKLFPSLDSCWFVVLCSIALVFSSAGTHKLNKL